MTHEEAEAMAERVKSQDDRVTVVPIGDSRGNYHLNLTLKRAKDGPLRMRVCNEQECDSVLQAWGLL